MTSLRSSHRWLIILTTWFVPVGGTSFSFAASAPVPTEAATPGFDRTQWQSRLEAFVNAPRFSGALWGVKVVSLDHSDLVFEAHADRLMSPASNAKLYVGALALDRLGGDYCVRTPLFTTVAPDAAGVVRGDLIVAGRGDPGWKARDEKKDFWTTFEPLVAAVEHAGIHEITGLLVADATYFAVAPAGDSWTADDMNEDFGAEISAITLEDNYADVRILPGEKAGDPCHVELVQPLTGIEIDNRTATLATGTKASVRLLRLPGETTARVFGGVPVGGKEELVGMPIPRPASWFAVAFKAALERRGIHVRGGTRGVRWPEAAPARGVAFPVGEIRSAPVRELVKGFMKPSQNLEADLIFLQVGESRRKAETPASTSANDLALVELHDFLQEHALRPDDVIFNEGSGLSRNDLTSAAATVSLLTFMHAHREQAAFMDSLPIAGVDGSLRRRFKGTPAENNLQAKTGTLRWANTLSGYMTTASGEHVVFSLMLNRYSSPTGREARQELDDLVALIAGYEARH